jgi:hypothetical protein
VVLLKRAHRGPVRPSAPQIRDPGSFGAITTISGNPGLLWDGLGGVPQAMPRWGFVSATQVFSDAELERLRRFPEISRDELSRFFTLTIPALATSTSSWSGTRPGTRAACPKPPHSNPRCCDRAPPSPFDGTKGRARHHESLDQSGPVPGRRRLRGDRTERVHPELRRRQGQPQGAEGMANLPDGSSTRSSSPPRNARASASSSRRRDEPRARPRQEDPEQRTRSAHSCGC